MFTGIIQCLGKVKKITNSGTNLIFEINAPIDEPVKVDQSIAHNGVCLTVTDLLYQTQAEKIYRVTAIDETLKKSNLGQLKEGDTVNIELCMRADHRVDGHFVQGHVDTTAEVVSIGEQDGSWLLSFSFEEKYAPLIVPKGSICINGVSLTVVEAGLGVVTAAIIPFTWTHTNFQYLKLGMKVNLEFDILGKYLARQIELRGLV